MLVGEEDAARVAALVHRLQRGVTRALAVLRKGLDLVPGAPASSLATGSQVLVLKPGVEICAPVCVAPRCSAPPSRTSQVRDVAGPGISR